MPLPTVKFEAFWDEQPTLATGWGNISLKLETIAALLICLAFGWVVWSHLGFPIRLPNVNFDFGVLGPLLCTVPFFISFKLVTIKRSFFDIVEGLIGSLVVPRVIPATDADLVPPIVE